MNINSCSCVPIVGLLFFSWPDGSSFKKFYEFVYYLSLSYFLWLSQPELASIACSQGHYLHTHHTRSCFTAHFLKKYLAYKLQSHLVQMQGSFKVIQNLLKFQHNLNMTFQCYQSEVTFIFHKLDTIRTLENTYNICR